MDDEVIEIPRINLLWSGWYRWKVLELDSRVKNSGVRVPNKKGVYEAKYEDERERLYIGKASDLRMRVKQGLVRCKVEHSASKRMKADGLDFSKIVVRWASTDRPSAAEEELHKRHETEFGRLPKYVQRT